MVWKNKKAKHKKNPGDSNRKSTKKGPVVEFYIPKTALSPYAETSKHALKKLYHSDWDGAIFAEAALERLAIENEEIDTLSDLLPAPAQGALMVVARTEDNEIHALLAQLNNPEAERCTHVERDFLRTLEGGCTAPIGALARCEGEKHHFFRRFIRPKRRKN